MKKALFLFSMVMGLCLSSCVSTHLTSFKAPIHDKYDGVVVVGDYEDIEMRDRYEGAIVDALTEDGAKAWKYIDLFPPIRKYDSVDYRAMRKKLGYSAMLFIEPNGTSTVSKTNVHENWYGGTTAESYDRLSGIYTIATLADIDSTRVIYKASISTSLDTDFGSSSEARKSMGRELSYDLIINGFLLSSKKLSR